MPIKSPSINIVSKELSFERCAAGCPLCDYGRCKKGRRHIGKHRCETCQRTFVVSRRSESSEEALGALGERAS